VDTYTDQQEYERLKAWWKDYGNAAMAGVVIGVVILFGHKYWTERQEEERAQASAIYADMLEASGARDGETVRSAGERLLKEHERTPYAAMAALLLARAAQEAGDMAKARAHLEWAMNNAAQEAVQHVARLRLARVFMAGGDDNAVLALIDVKDKAGFEAEYAELRGDVLHKLGRRDEARAAYREALERVREPGGYQAVIKMKLDDLGAGNPS
jgi:predicted negative regulator of RcsB-dependent stress response